MVVIWILPADIVFALRLHIVVAHCLCACLDAGCWTIGPGWGTSLYLSSCSLWRQNIVQPYNSWAVGQDVPDVNNGFGLLAAAS